METIKIHRSISEIAYDIVKEWKANSKSGVYFGAVPYLNAMKQLNGPDDMYGLDDAKTIIIYFLGNAQTFRGEKAKALKQELKTMFNIK